MRNYSAHLTGKDSNTLRTIIGSPIQTIQTDSLDVYPDHCRALSFALCRSLDSLYFIHADWLETPRTEADYYQIIVRHDDSGKYIENLTATVHLDNDSPVASIDVLHAAQAYSEDGDTPLEAVDYDSALVFRRQDATAFVLEIPNDISGFIHLYELDQHREDALLTRLSLRTTITASRN